jgi:altronate dehydratase small subunit
METIMVMKENDNVAVCLSERKAGEVVEVGLSGETSRITLLDDIPFAHKFSLTDIDTGETIIKYGEVIGTASKPILVGQWVHVHNVESVRGRGDKQ